MAALRPLALTLLLAFAAPARASDPPIPLQYNLAVDASVTAAMGLSVVLLTVYQRDLLPTSCHWCEPPALDASVRNALVWDEGARAADLASTVLVAAVPASAFTYLLLSANGAGDVNAGLVDSLLVTEAVAAALLLNQAVKLLVGRQRPYAHFGNQQGYSKSEDNLSFYSGHTSLAFSVAAATVTLASMRGYAGAGIVAGVGFTMGLGIGYLRIAADQHYLTDVLVGAVIGGLVGWAVPRIFHSPEPAAPNSPPAAALRAPAFSFRFAF